MGRRKIEIKKIESPRARMVTFSKRRQGLFKKAREFSQLSGLRVAVLVFSQAGKPYFSGDASLLDRFMSQEEGDLGSDCFPSDGCEYMKGIDNGGTQNDRIDNEMGVVHDTGLGGSDGYGWKTIGMGDESDGEGLCVHECDDTVLGGCASDCEFDGGSDWIGMVDWENAETDSSTWRDEEQVLGFDQNECFDGLQDLDSDFDWSVNPIL